MRRPQKADAALLLAAAVLVSACDPAQPPPQTGPVSFRETTIEAGLTHASESFDAAIGDLDGNGRPDIYIANHGAKALLFDTAATGPWTERVTQARLDPYGDQHGIGAADFDNDGDLDLYVSVGAGRGRQKKANRLYRNDGTGVFTDVGRAAGLADPEGRSRAVAWLDIDRDGRLDLMLGNYDSPARLFRGRPDGTFFDATPELALHEAAALAWWTDYDADLDPDILVRTRSGLKLLRNQSGRFVDATDAAGLGGVDQHVGGASFADANGDGILDLYLGYGTQYVESVVQSGDDIRFAFFAGDDPKGFDFRAVEPGIEVFRNGNRIEADQIQCGMETLPAGTAKVCGQDSTANDLPAGGGLVLFRDPSSEGESTWHLRWRGDGDHHLAGILHDARDPEPAGLGSWLPSGGDLWIGQRDGTFRRAEAHGIEHDANVQMVTWADFNNDGWLDLYIVDGGTEGAGRPNLLFLNQGGRSFRRSIDETAAGTPPPGGERASAGQPLDYDGDGRLDLLLLYGLGVRPFDKGPYQLLRNESDEAHWIDIRLRGTESNRQGLGAWVVVNACGRRQTRFYDGGRGSLSQSALPLHFGLGNCPKIDSIEIRWPSGVVQTAGLGGVDQIHEIEEKL
jgi:hypothetical protein